MDIVGYIYRIKIKKPRCSPHRGCYHILNMATKSTALQM